MAGNATVEALLEKATAALDQHLHRLYPAQAAVIAASYTVVDESTAHVSAYWVLRSGEYLECYGTPAIAEEVRQTHIMSGLMYYHSLVQAGVISPEGEPQ